jgi:hypothetical protein
VVQAVEQVVRVGLELVQVVRRLGTVVDLEGDPAYAPVVVAHHRAAAGLDVLLDVPEDLRAPLFGRVGIEHDHEVVEVRHGGEGISGNSLDRGEFPAPGP